MPGSRIVRWAALSDNHSHRDERFEKALRLIAKHRPHYMLHLGDLVEAEAASKWPKEASPSLLKEYETCDGLLRDIGKSLPSQCQRVFLEGNHEANIGGKNRLDPALRDLCDYRQRIPAMADWRVVPYRYDRNGVVRIGQVTFAHGYEQGTRSDQHQAVLLGCHNGLFVSGHTHRRRRVEQVMFSPTIPLSYFCCNTGTLGPLKPEYMHRKRTHLWGGAVAMGEALLGRAHRNEVNWSAEVTFID